MKAKAKRLKIKPKEFYFDPQGNQIPPEMVSDKNKLKEYVTELLVLKAIKLNEEIKKLKEYAFDMIDRYEDEKYRIEAINRLKRGIAPEESLGEPVKAGYCTITSYSGKYMVSIDAAPYYTFGDDITKAKKLMAAVIHESIDSPLKAAIIKIFDDAFGIQKGSQVKIDAILRLLNYQVDDERWKEGARILREELQILERQRHLSFRYRDQKTGKLVPVILDISRV